ncbi:MAG: amidohydrolase family protein [bacterium]|nr:D-aminoacylase [Gammaproteobacteria bacterium]HIL98712.1 D-aminoacylase [Pseudomonadales bacterium]
MAYDLVIKNGTVIDGSGMPRYHADVGIREGRIENIGRINEKSTETIDAEGHIVSPGFVDGHTHMDAQVAWDPLGTCSCWHGVTSVVMGNCGFTLAPCRESEKDMVMRNLERAEDISPAAMDAGIEWSWETFPQYLDAVDKLPKGINYAGYIGHSALRTYVMGERAFEAPATEDDLRLMGHELTNAIKAGAIGFSTSRTPNHQTPDDRPVASRIAEWSEVEYLVNKMGVLNAGIFEIAHEQPGRNPERVREYFDRMKKLAIDSGRPMTWGMFSTRVAPELWRPFFDLLDEVANEGGRMFAQTHSRALNVLLSFKSNLPFDNWDHWKEIRNLPIDQQINALRDPAIKARLIEAANKRYEGPRKIGTEARPPKWEWIFPLFDMKGPYQSIAEIAKSRGKDNVETMIDLALERDLDLFFMQPIANEDQDHVIEMMKHPRSVVTFSDSGAHVSQIMDSSLQTHVFSHWVREKQALTLEEAVRMVTFEPATLWGLNNRGLIRQGFAADITILDPETICPRLPEVVYDLPAGARRLKQKADGILATVVNGKILMKDCEHTGELPGQLIRGPLAAG